MTKFDDDQPLSTKRYEKSQSNCNHQFMIDDSSESCPTCGMYYVYCAICTLNPDNLSGTPIYHNPPSCI